MSMEDKSSKIKETLRQGFLDGTSKSAECSFGTTTPLSFLVTYFKPYSTQGLSVPARSYNENDILMQISLRLHDIIIHYEFTEMSK